MRMVMAAIFSTMVASVAIPFPQVQPNATCQAADAELDRWARDISGPTSAAILVGCQELSDDDWEGIRDGFSLDASFTANGDGYSCGTVREWVDDLSGLTKVSFQNMVAPVPAGDGT